MENKQNIFLPGSDKMLNFVIGNAGVKDKKILVIGSSSEKIAERFIEEGATRVELIVEDYSSLLNSNLILGENENINPKMMSFDVTDFNDNSFDIVYAQASISTDNRNKIIKEIKRILIDEGLLAVGEIVKLQRDVPPFVQDIFNYNSIEPIYTEEINEYFEKRNFKVVQQQNYSKSLKEYYSLNLKKLDESLGELSEKEKSYYKKLINQISHQSKAFLKQGADQYIGFYAILAQLFS